MSTSQRLSRTNSPEKKVKKSTNTFRRKARLSNFVVFILSLFHCQPPLLLLSQKNWGGREKSIFFSRTEDKSLVVVYISYLFLARNFFRGGNTARQPIPTFFPWGKRKKNLPLVNQPPISTLPPSLFLSGLASSPSIKVVTRKNQPPFSFWFAGVNVCGGGRWRRGGLFGKFRMHLNESLMWTHRPCLHISSPPPLGLPTK